MTENGWPACGPDLLDRNPVPGTSIVIPLQRGLPNVIMKAFAADFHAYVESLYNARGGSDEGGWTGTNSVPTSNHLGGTAMDLNWSDHTFRVSYAGFTQKEIDECRALLAWYEGMIFWGQDWNTPKDAMHFQMGYNTYNNIAKCNDFVKRKIRADGFSTYRRGGTGGGTNPPVVVQPVIWAERGSNGDHVKRLQQFLKDNFDSYAGALAVDGDFGPATEAAVREFQTRSGIDSDGVVGPITLEFLKRAGFRPEGGNVVADPPAPAKKWPADATDRELLEWLVNQFGPKLPNWGDDSSFGQNADGKEMTFRDGMAALKRTVDSLQ